MQAIQEIYKSFFSAPVIDKKNGEFASACPWCNDGIDRFVMRERGMGNNKNKKFWCRKCGIAGDKIALLTQAGLSFHEAKAYLGESGNSSSKSATRKGSLGRKGSSASQGSSPVAETAAYPSARWIKTVEKQAQEAAKGLKSDKGKAWLRERCLTLETALYCHIGYLPQGKWIEPQNMGLNGKSVHLSAGAYFFIRRLVDGKARIVDMVCRRESQGEAAKYGKFQQFRGGAKVPFICKGAGEETLVIVESAICAATVWQESGGEITALALNGATKRLDALTAKYVAKTPIILVAGDNDDAGQEIFENIRKLNRHTFRWQPRGAKDPNDMLRAGLSVLDWLEDGIGYADSCIIGKAQTKQPPIPETVPEPPQAETSLPAKAIESSAANEPPAVPTQFCFRGYFPILSCIQNGRGFTIDFEAEGIILYVNRWNKSYVDNGAYDWLEGQSARLIAECTALRPSLAKANIPANSVRVEVVPDDKSLPCTGYPSLLHFLWTMFEASELLADPTSNELRLSDKAAALCADYWKEYYRREDDPFFA